MKTKNKILPEQEEEKTFQYRTYGKGELALLYLPNILQQSAVDRFNEWIEAAPGLKERLLATGMNPRARYYTPAQVRLIIEVLQEPELKYQVLGIRYQVLTVVNTSQQRITS